MSLRAKVFMPLAVLSLLLAVFLYGYWMPRSLANIDMGYQRATERHLDSVTEGLVPLLLGHQLDTVYENLNALLEKNRDWIGITLTDGSGRPLYPLEQAPTFRRSLQGDVRTLTRSIDYLGTHLGALTVSVDFAPRLSELQQKHRELALVVLAVIIAFALSVGLLIDRLVVQPVNALSLAATRLAKGDFNGALPAGGNDEVGRLVGRFSEMRGAIRDYQSELLERSRTIKQSEKRLAEAQRIARMGSWILDLQKNVLSWSDEIYRIFGVQPQEFGATYEAFLERVHPGDRARVSNAYDSSAQKDAPYDIVHRIIRKSNGETRWVHQKCEHVRDLSGATAYSFGTVQDITEQKQSEDALRESEEKFASLAASAQDAIIMIDQEGRCEYWNSGAERIFGHCSADVLNRDLHAVITPRQYRELFRKGFAGFHVTGQGAVLGKVIELAGLRSDGTEFPVELSVSSLKLGGAWHAVGIIRDITERKKLEAQLRQSQKMEAIGQLAGGVAHDINNILQAIVGYSSVLQMKMAGDDPLRVNVNHLLESTERAAQLTQSLLAFSRKQVMHLKPVRPNDIITRLEKFLRRIIGEDIEFKTILREDAVILADSGQIEQVLMNLAANARDAMPKGGHLVIETEEAELTGDFAAAHGIETPGAYIVISVTDSGSGMDEETKQKIFEPFFTTKELGRGTGLGLSIVYGIVKQHGGYINVYSQIGLGTTFRIYLPVQQAQVETEQAPPAPEPVVGGKETILLAEDDAVLRKFFYEVLTEFGYTVIAVQDGEEAVGKFTAQEETIQLCLLDMIMPKKGGREVYEMVHRRRPAVKAVFMSGYTVDKIQREGIPEGCDFIQKPVTPQFLLKKIRDLLDGQAAQVR